MKRLPPKGSAARIIVLTIIPTYLLMALIGVALVAVDRQQDRTFAQEQRDREAGDRRIIVQRTVATCDERNLTKAAIRGTIDAALTGDAPFDLTQAPSFDQLPPIIQQFVREISQRPSSSSAESLRLYRATLVDEDCIQIGVDLADDLGIPIPDFPTTTTTPTGDT